MGEASPSAVEVVDTAGDLGEDGWRALWSLVFSWAVAPGGDCIFGEDSFDWERTEIQCRRS